MPNRELVEEITLLLHGVRSTGKGFQPLCEDLRASDSFPEDKHRIKYYKYGPVPAIGTMWEGQGELLVDAFSSMVHRQTAYQKAYDGPKYPNLTRVNIVAHSFGTWGACEFLKRYPQCQIGTLVLCAGVVPRDFPWSDIVESGRVDTVINLIPSRDIVPAVAEFASWIRATSVDMGGCGSRWSIGWPLLSQQTGFHDHAVVEDTPNVHNWVLPGGHTAYTKKRWRIAIKQFLEDTCLHV